MSASAKNMEAVVKARDNHDKTCPWGGRGVRVLLHPFEIERMGWEEGDNIAGLTVVADTSLSTGMLSIECDAEPKNDDILKLAENTYVQVDDRDLVPA